MQAETQQAYDSAKELLEQFKRMNKLNHEALDKKGEAEISLASVLAMVTKELEEGGTSKTALKEVAKGDKRVLEAQANLIKAKIEVKKTESYISYTEQAHSLEKKRMSAEMEEAKKFGGQYET